MSAKPRTKTGTAKPKPKPKTDAPTPAELDAIHRKAIDSIDAAGKAMSVARANVEMAQSPKDRNKAAAKAGQVVGAALRAPGRDVVKLLKGLSTLFPPCKLASSALSALIKHEVDRPAKDVRVSIVHFDLARALVHIGSLNRKSRPAKSIADPLSKLLKDFKDLIKEFDLFCETYYENALKHQQHQKWNKDNLNSFADRIARLKRSLTSLLFQQAVQHPGKHAQVLEQMDSRLVQIRVFYATNEEIAETFLSKQLKQGGEASVRPVQGGRPLKKSAGTVGGISSAKRKTTASTKKQVQKPVAKTSPGAKTTRPGVKPSFASKLQGSFGKLVSGKQQKDRADTKPGRPRLPPRSAERSHKQAPTTTHAPARGQRTGQQQKKGTSENRGKPQTSRGQGRQSLNTVNTVADSSYQSSSKSWSLRETDSAELEQEEEYGDSEEEAEEEAENSEDPELEEEYGDSEEEAEEEAEDSEDPELEEEEYGDSEEEAEDSEDPELEEEYGDSEEGAEDSEDPELEEEYGDSEEGAGDSEDPEEEESGGSEEGAGDSEDPEEEESEGAGDSEDPEEEESGGGEPGDESE